MSNAALALEQRELILGRYRPLRPLGSGGSGSVWLARDEQTGLDVSLKIVAREGKAAARAEREAAAAARLRHPSCLRAYAFAHDARHVYIAYEYVPGRTMRHALSALLEQFVIFFGNDRGPDGRERVYPRPPPSILRLVLAETRDAGRQEHPFHARLRPRLAARRNSTLPTPRRTRRWP